MGARLEVGARLMMNPDDYVRGSKRAKKETKELDKEINKVGKTSKKTGKELSGLSKKTDEAGSSSDKTGESLSGLERKSKSLSVSIASLAGYLGPAVFGAALVFAVRKGAEFETKMAEISTLMDDTSALDATARSIREMAIEFGGEAPAQASAMYQIISAGAEDAAEANEILAASNKLAIGGVTDITTAAGGLTSILNAYGDQVENATAVSDAMFVAMKAGKTTIAELSSSIGGVAPLAATLGIEFDELLAAVSALTLGGVSTSEAMTGLQGVLVAVTKPTEEALKLAKELSIEFTTQALKTKGLSGFLAELQEKTGGSAEAMATLFGQVEGLTKVLALTGNQADEFTEILVKMENKAGATEVAFGKMTDTFNFEWDVLTANINDVGFALSDNLLPVLTDVVAGFNLWFDVVNRRGQTMDDLRENMLNAVDEVNRFSLAMDETRRSFDLGNISAAEYDRRMQRLIGQHQDAKTAVNQFNQEMLAQSAGFKNYSAQIAAVNSDLEAFFKNELAIGSVVEKSTGGIDKQAIATKKKGDATAKINKDLDAFFKNENKVAIATGDTTKVMKKYGLSLADVSNDTVVLQQLLDAGEITWGEYTNAIMGTQEGFQTFESAGKESVSAVDQIAKNFIRDTQRGFGDLIYNNFKQGFSSFSDFAKDAFGTVQDLFYRLVANMAAKWLVSGIAGFLAGNGTSGFSFGGGGGSPASQAGSIALNAGFSKAASAAWGKVAGSSFGQTISGYFSGSNAPALLGPNVAGSGGSGVLSAPPIGSGVSPVYGAGNQALLGPNVSAPSAPAGGAWAAWGAAAVAAYLVVGGAMKAAAIDKQNAQLTNEFNRLRTETTAFDGELVQLSSTMSIVGQEGGNMYLYQREGLVETQSAIAEYQTQLEELGITFTSIYGTNEEAVWQLTGSVEALAAAQDLMSVGISEADLVFTQFTDTGTSGLSSLTAQFRGDTTLWTKLMDSAMKSGMLSADSSFQFIADQFGNTVLQMNGDAQLWAQYLSSQGLLAANAMANSFQIIDAAGNSTFANLSSAAQQFQALLLSLQAPNLNLNVPAGGGQQALNGPYKTGVYNIPSDNFPMLADKSEMLLPAPVANWFRSDKPIVVRGGKSNQGDNKEVTNAFNQLAALMVSVKSAVIDSAETIKAAVDENTEARPDHLKDSARITALRRVGATI